MHRKDILAFALIIAGFIFALPGCKVVEDNVNENPNHEVGENAEMEPSITVDENMVFGIIGDWGGWDYMLPGEERFMISFGADGKCNVQRGNYADYLGPVYYGDYNWSEDEKYITLDMYQGVPYEQEGEGPYVPWYLWLDEGRENSKVTLNLSFRIYGGSVRTFALKANAGGIDSEGYAIVDENSFVVFSSWSSEDYFLFPFGSSMITSEGGGRNRVVNPDTFLETSEHYQTIAEQDVYCGPGDDYVSLGRVPSGILVCKIACMATGNDWAFVLFDGGGGWVNIKGLS